MRMSTEMGFCQMDTMDERRGEPRHHLVQLFFDFAFGDDDRGEHGSCGLEQLGFLGCETQVLFGLFLLFVRFGLTFGHDVILIVY